MLSFETLRAEFNQSVTTDNARSLRYSGTLYLQQPDRALWIYTTPIKKSIYIRGEAVTVVEPELFQATHLRQSTAQNILELFEQSEAIAPGHRQAVFNDTVVDIRHDARFITHLHYIDEFEHNVSIRFLEPEIDPWLEPGFFQPEIPERFDQFKTR
jgi:outer membrane lipoprotein-sorting protein